ncbi:ATP-binding protein [Streptomyces sp. TS71-3]|uniref:sensor histidine kinase n=1 Tax=Streptomyces sp. TS71-3 TaxID=2733862 RepID=UPI001BB3FBFF|nr:ATP-binding protein [Streptomyces sp. TS71-3]
MKGRIPAPGGRLPRRPGPRHPWLATGAAAAGIAALTAVLVAARGGLSLADVVLVYLAAIVVIAAAGGVWLGLAAAVASTLLVNFFFVPPYHTLDVANRDLVVTVLVYVASSVTVSVAVDLIARWRHEAERLAAQAARARELAETDKVRAALLAAVGHDLRTPLAGIKASVSSLREPDLPLTGDQREELLATVEESADKMNDLVENLLAISRLQAGAVSVHPRAVTLDEVAATALLHTAVPPGRAPLLDIAEDLPAAWADPGLLERVIANLVANALEASPPDRPVELAAESADGRLRLHIVDHGPGIPAEQQERIFAPFTRLGDPDAGRGLGLGLAIARGFTEAMHGTLTPGDTPGGGLTMTLTLPVAVAR